MTEVHQSHEPYIITTEIITKRKIFSVMLLAVALIFISGQTNQAEAGEVYMGRYSDGSAVYLLTHTSVSVAAVRTVSPARSEPATTISDILSSP